MDCYTLKWEGGTSGHQAGKEVALQKKIGHTIVKRSPPFFFQPHLLPPLNESHMFSFELWGSHQGISRASLLFGGFERGSVSFPSF
jgi:hypothetical protein